MGGADGRDLGALNRLGLRPLSGQRRLCPAEDIDLIQLIVARDQPQSLDRSLGPCDAETRDDKTYQSDH
jgi:hypothetical protein